MNNAIASCVDLCALLVGPLIPLGVMAGFALLMIIFLANMR